MVNILRYSIRLSVLILATLIFHSLSALTVNALEKTITNSIGMEFVLVPGGTFKMGSPMDEPNRKRKEVERRVTISKPFYMQNTEVTVKQWRAVMGKRFFIKKKGTDHMPVVKVSWQDSIDFIEKLNALNEGVYRLPTDFGAILDDFRWPSTDFYAPIPVIGEPQLMVMRPTGETGGVPTYAAIRPVSSTGVAGQRQEVQFHVWPSTHYALRL